MIRDIDSFIRYFEGIRRRTLNFARVIPHERIDWSPQENAFTCGDILRHLAAIETITIHVVVHDHWQVYPGHDRNLAADMEEILNYLEASHVAAMGELRTIPDAALNQTRPTITGHPIKAWRLLMSIIEHEVHHRSQLASYLESMGIEPPQIFGLQVDDVAALSAQLANKHS
jgi:uncharacterized damage-inducible protein DinB